jgi:hypothetical protein
MICLKPLKLGVAGASEDCGLVKICAVCYSAVCRVLCGNFMVRRWRMMMNVLTI